MPSGMIRRMRLTIVVPAHNEEARIGRMLDAYLPYFSSRYGRDVEMIVVINGTTDRTEQVIAGYAARFPMLRACVEPKRVGKGGALMIGFGAAQGDYVGFVDADGATPPEAFDALVTHIGDAGAIIASRWCRGAQVSPRQPLARRIASRIFNLLTRVFFDLRITDTQCGAKLMRRDALRQVMPRLGITRWAFDVDLLFQLRRKGYRVTEVPTVWHDVAGSKLNVGQASLEMGLALVRLRLLYSPFKGLVTLHDRLLGRWINPEALGGDKLIVHSAMVMAGSQVSNLCNLAFQMIMVRLLGESEYGIMAALMGVLVMLGLPLSALGTTVMHFIAHDLQLGRRDAAKGLLRQLAIDMAWPSLLILAGCWFMRQPLMGYFHIEEALLLYLTAGAVVLSIYTGVGTNALAGLQAFGLAATVGNAWSVLRLAFCAGLVMLGMGAIGAMVGHVAAVSIGTATVAVVLWRRLGDSPVAEERVPGVYAYFLKSVGAWAAYGVLSMADVILARHYFTAVDAGAFAKAAMVARVVFFLPTPIAGAMFPKVVSSGAASRASGQMLAKAVGLVAVITVAAVGFCSLFPAWVLRVVAHVEDPALEPVMVAMAWALAPVSVVAVLLNYEMAQRRFIVAVPLVLCAAGYAGAVACWHEAMWQIPAALGVAATLALILTVLCLPWREMRMPDEAAADG